MSRRSSIDDDAESIAARVQEDLGLLAQISLPGDGVSRLAYSKHDAEARLWFREQCQQAGLDFQVDPAGNCLAWMPHTSHKRPLLMGSHLDSVPAGGRYDGTVGVVLGIELLRYLHASRRPVPLAVANFACEESTRFGFGAIGSKYFVGDLDGSSLAALTDRDGSTLGAVLERAGISALGPKPVAFADAFRGYLEVHIDQGTTLLSQNSLLGSVTHISGVHRIESSWVGQTAHSGGQLRKDRRDALIGAAAAIVQLSELWRDLEQSGANIAITVGSMSVHPNSPNAVPGRVDMIVDVRSVDWDMLEGVADQVKALCEGTSEAHRLKVSVRELGGSKALATDEAMNATLRDAASDLRIEIPPCISLAGHDALVIGRHVPATMLLLANPTGISHAPEEAVDSRAILQAIRVLLHGIPRLVDHLGCE